MCLVQTPQSHLGNGLTVVAPRSVDPVFGLIAGWRVGLRSRRLEGDAVNWGDDVRLVEAAVASWFLITWVGVGRAAGGFVG